MQTGRRGRANRQPRDTETSNNSRGRGLGRGETTSILDARYPTRGSIRTPNRGRGTFTPRSHSDFPSVPPYTSITPGHGVSIILKEDQPTGHQVKGIVADLLTRGDHPRGVKVRLRDGRVGRVQGLVSESEGERGEAVVGGSAAGVGRNGQGGRNIGGGRMVGGRVERDIREEDEYLYDEGRRQPAEVGLFAALEEADRRHKPKSEPGEVGIFAALEGADRRHQRKSEPRGEVAVCPVCGEFEGDEKAVAHHVEEHFAE